MKLTASNGKILDSFYLFRTNNPALYQKALQEQQLIGRVWGAAGAVGLRIVFVAIVSYLLVIPLLQLIGGLLLIWIALKLVRQSDGGGASMGSRALASWVLFCASWVRAST